jgi:hypothetical protein
MISDGNGPDPRFPVENSSIRGRGWYPFNPRVELNGEKFIPVGDGGGGDNPPSPFPRSPANKVAWPK